jgi:MFS family permease
MEGPFARVAVAAGLSNLGDGLRLVALPLLATATTRDPVLISGLVVFAYLPWVLCGLPIGTLVDRGRPEVFMRAANTARVVLLGLLTVGVVADLDSIGLLYLLAFLLGVGEALYDNAAQSLLPRIVPDPRLESANSTLITLERLGQDLVGPALAGLLFAASALLPFGLNAVLLAVSVALLVGITTAAPASSGASPLRGIAAETVAGMRWLWRATFVRRLILTGAALTFATMFWESTLVLFALGPIGVSPTGYGLILAVGAVGGVLGAMATPWLVARYDRWLLQLAGLGLCAAVDLMLAVHPAPATAALAWGGTGFGFAIWNVVSISTRQRIVPTDILGRVNSAARTISMSAVPLGALAGGITADRLGLGAPVWISGAGLVALVMVYALLSRSDRHLLNHGARIDDPEPAR